MNCKFRILIIIMTKCRDSCFWYDYKQPISILLIAITHLSKLHHAYVRGTVVTALILVYDNFFLNNHLNFKQL